MDESFLENPIIRIIAGFGLLLAATDVMVGLFFGVFRLLGIFDFGAFERLWNLDRTTWFTMLVVLGLWIVIAIVAKLDQVLMIAVACIYFFWVVLVRNIAIELPDFLRNLFFVVEPLLALIGVGLGFLTLIQIKGSMNLSADSLGNAMGATPFGAASAGSSPAPPAPGATSPAPPAPEAASPAAPSPAAPSPTPEPEPAAAQAPGWFPDPKGEATYRWWDGSTWTDNTHEG